MSANWRTSPDHDNEGWPDGVPYIIGNEGCERFSFYGMKAILFVHLAALYVAAGEVAKTAEDFATSDVHTFIAGVYAFPMIGAIVADRLLGKYRTILWLSIVYCAGHFVLSIGENTIFGMQVGLGLIAVGSGGIKPCVSANVGDQFGKKNWFRVRTVFQIFYFAINLGSACATIFIPRIKAEFGTSVAFAIPGILMGLATIVFWLGRHKYVHVPPKPGGKVGLLDAASSICLFLSFGQLFVTASQPLWVILLVGAAFLVVGMLLFMQRQRIAPDDGFLAILFGTLFRRDDRPVVVGGTDASGAYATPVGVPGAEPAVRGDGTWLRDEDKGHALAESGFWGPAVRRFGADATAGPVAVLKIISIFIFVSMFWALFDQHSSSWIRQAKMLDLAFPLPGNPDFKFLPSETPALNPIMVMILIPLMNQLYKLSDKLGFEATPLRRMTVGMFMAALSFVVVAWIQMRVEAEGVGTVSVAWQLIPYLLITVSEVMVSVTGLEFAYTQAPKRMKSTIMGFWLLTVALGNVFVAVIAKIEGYELSEFFWFFAVAMAVFAGLFGLRAKFYKTQDFAQD